MRTIGVVTTSRADYSVYLPLLREIQSDPELDLYLLVGGMHLSPEFGLTSEVIEADGFQINDRVEMLLSSDTPEGIAKSMGLGTIGFAQSYARFRPDILVVLGDRFEMHAAALAALPFKIPVAHIHGGEVTQGAFDDALRHSMTKLSHLHMVSHEEYGNRILQMGEEPWRVTMAGALSLDNLHTIELPGVPELEAKYGVSLDPPPLLVTYHPVTLEYEQTQWQVDELLAALGDCGMPVVFTGPNADTMGRTIAKAMKDFVRDHPNAWMVDSLGIKDYFGLMAVAPAMVGNSSSGIVEAASFCLPVVNIGTRQEGRIRTANIIDVGYSRREVLQGIWEAVSDGIRDKLGGISNPYGDGHAADRISGVLKQVALDDQLLIKKFVDLRDIPNSTLARSSSTVSSFATPSHGPGG